MLDHSILLINSAQFRGTYMETHAEQLMFENISKNMSDADEYPAMMQMHARCISILAHLWGVQKGEKAIGSATTGSSEAIHLGGLAMKRRWQEKRTKEGKDTSKPNIIMGANAQVALEKFARYFEVEARILPVSEASQYRLDTELVKQNIDENTIGVFVILGSTYTGHYEPVEDISKVLDEYEAKTGVDIPIHVDAASGGFIAPFTHAEAGGPKWNFELPRVKSINTSGHKFELVYAGVGWIIWRDESQLPKHLVFELHYLGGTEESQLLPPRRPSHRPILQPDPPRLQRLPADHGKLPFERPAPLQIPRSHRLVHLRVRHPPQEGRARLPGRPGGRIRESRRDVRRLQRRPARRRIPLQRRVQEGAPALKTGDDLEPAPRQAVHHPQLPAAAGGGEDGDPARGGEGVDELRSAGSPHCGYLLDDAEPDRFGWAGLGDSESE